MNITLRERLNRELSDTDDVRGFDLQDATRINDGERIHLSVSAPRDCSMGQLATVAPAFVNAAFSVTDDGGVSGVIHSSDWYARFEASADVRDSDGDERRALVRESVEPYPSVVF